eukprot:5312142-Heterocapsa_arctica.AAC.1
MEATANPIEWDPGHGSSLLKINDMECVWWPAELSPSRLGSKHNGARATRTLWRPWKPGGLPMA